MRGSHLQQQHHDPHPQSGQQHPHEHPLVNPAHVSSPCACPGAGAALRQLLLCKSLQELWQAPAVCAAAGSGLCWDGQERPWVSSWLAAQRLGKETDFVSKLQGCSWSSEVGKPLKTSCLTCLPACFPACSCLCCPWHQCLPGVVPHPVRMARLLAELVRWKSTSMCCYHRDV